MFWQWLVHYKCPSSDNAMPQGVNNESECDSHIYLARAMLTSTDVGGWVVRWPWVFSSSAGASYNLDDSRPTAYCACSRCGWGLFGIFTLFYPFSPMSPSLWETARYRLKYCLKGPLNPKQPTNQPTSTDVNEQNMDPGLKDENCALP